MAYDRTNLFVGDCTLYVDGVDVGWTRGGVRMRVNKSLWARPSLSGLGADEMVKQSEEYYVSTVLVETTVLNLRQAWGINEAAVGRRVDFGGSTTVPVHTLRFVARDSFFEAYFYKVVAVDFGEVTCGPKGDMYIPATFRALIDTAKAVGAQVGYIIRGASSYSNLVMRLSVPKIKTNTLWSRVTVVYISGSKDLVCRATVPMIKTRQLVSRVTVV